jgi:hypothetical protein
LLRRTVDGRAFHRIKGAELEALLGD